MKKLFVLTFLFLLSFCRMQAQDVFDAARKGDLVQLEKLSNLNPDTLSSRNESGFTPLIIAGYRNQMKVVEFLLKHKVNINAGSPEGPVILGACYKGNLELAKLLVSHSADVNVQNEQGTSALIFAVLSNNYDLVKFLLEHGAKKELKEKNGNTSLTYAKVSGSAELIRLLSDD